MANLASANISHTWAGEEILTPIFYKPEEGSDSIFGSNYRFMEVVFKSNVYLPNKLRKILRKYTDCGFTAAGGTFAIDSKTISVDRVKANTEQCVEEFWSTIFDTVVKRGIDRNDLDGTQVANIVLRQFQSGLASDIARYAWFGDADSTNTDWNLDGWLSIALDNSNDLGHTFTLSAKETAGKLNTDAALETMRELYDNQTEAMDDMEDSDKRFYVSKTVWNNYLATLEDTSFTEGWRSVQDGITRLFFRDIELYKVPGWQTNLTDSTNPLKSLLGDNVIVLTTPDNLIAASDTNDPMSEFKIRDNDDDDEKMKFLAKFKLGFQIVHESLIGLAASSI